MVVSGLLIYLSQFTLLLCLIVARTPASTLVEGNYLDFRLSTTPDNTTILGGRRGPQTPAQCARSFKPPYKLTPTSASLRAKRGVFNNSGLMPNFNACLERLFSMLLKPLVASHKNRRHLLKNCPRINPFFKQTKKIF